MVGLYLCLGCYVGGVLSHAIAQKLWAALKVKLQAEIVKMAADLNKVA